MGIIPSKRRTIGIIELNRTGSGFKDLFYFFKKVTYRDLQLVSEAVLNMAFLSLQLPDATIFVVAYTKSLFMRKGFEDVAL